MRKWWALQHITGGSWFSEKIITICGIPLCTMMFRACGPFKTLASAEVECIARNEN